MTPRAVRCARRSPAGRPDRGRRVRRVRRVRWDDGGQVSVELLGITPLILLVLLLVWQFVLVGYTLTLAGDAAGRAARAAAVGTDPGAAADRDLPSAWAAGATTSVGEAGSAGDTVTVEVALKVPVLVPGVVPFPFTVHGDAGAVRETP